LVATIICTDNNVAEIMDPEDPYLYYTSGSTGKPKGMVHTAGYMEQSIYLKMYLTTKKVMFFGVPLILVGSLDILIFCTDPCLMALLQ
jgi:acyl-coenzyme A synthetase/AMP-(fatty) acid ligase